MQKSLLTLERTSQELNVVGLIGADTLDVGVEGGVETGVGEVLLGVLGETLTVEGILEVLKSESVVEDDI